VCTIRFYNNLDFEISQELDSTNSNALSKLRADVDDMLHVDFLLPHRIPGDVWLCQPEGPALALFAAPLWSLIFEKVLVTWVQRHVEL